MAADSDDLQLFCDLHGGQLVSSAVPGHLWPAICHKVQRQIFDAGEFFSMMKNEETNTWRITVTAEQISASDPNR